MLKPFIILILPSTIKSCHNQSFASDIGKTEIIRILQTYFNERDLAIVE